MKKLILITIIFFQIINTVYASQQNNTNQELSDPNYSDCRWIFQSEKFIFSKWDSIQNKGYGILESGELFYVYTYTGYKIGARFKYFLNDYQPPLLEANIKGWLDNIKRLCKIFLIDSDYKVLLNAIQNNQYKYSKDKGLEIYLDNGKFELFSVWVTPINHSTTALLCHFYY